MQQAMRNVRNSTEKNTLSQLLIRKTKLESIFVKRKTNIEYLKKVNEGGVFWMNVCQLTTNDIEHYCLNVTVRQRILMYYYLTLSLDYIMMNHQSKDRGNLLRSSFQLMEEYDFYVSNIAMQGVKSMMAKSSPFIFPQALTKTIEEEIQQQSFKPSIHKFQNNIVYEQLKTPHVAFQLDYVEVLVALCDSLCNFYAILLHSDESCR